MQTISKVYISHAFCSACEQEHKGTISVFHIQIIFYTWFSWITLILDIKNISGINTEMIFPLPKDRLPWTQIQEKLSA